MNGPQLSMEDFKNVLLDLYLLQRENQALHAQLQAMHAPQAPDPSGEVTDQ